MKRKTDSQSIRPFHAETDCVAVLQSTKKRCGNKAKFWSREQAWCAQHCSVKRFPDREPLARNPDAKQRKIQQQTEHDASVEQAATQNRSRNVVAGEVILAKLKQRKAAPRPEGYLQCWPNKDHGGYPGFAAPELSPFNLPVLSHKEHYFYARLNGEWQVMNVTDQHLLPQDTDTKLEPVPMAATIENYHQTAKVYSFELDKEGKWPAQPFFQLAKERYLAKQAQRHKYDKALLKQYMCKEAEEAGNPNISLYSFRTDTHGRFCRFTYVQSRVFYCRPYAAAAPQTKAYQELKARIYTQKQNVCILGFDAKPYTDKDWQEAKHNLSDMIYTRYKDPSCPFGHEQVLHALLVLSNAHDLPWERYIQDNAALYKDHF